MQVRRRSRLPFFLPHLLFAPLSVTLVKGRINVLEKLRIRLLIFDHAVYKCPKKSYKQLTELSTHIWWKEFEIKWTPFKGRPIQDKKVLPEKAGMAVLVTQKKMLVRHKFNFLHALEFLAWTRYEKSKAGVFASWAACHGCIFLCSVVVTGIDGTHLSCYDSHHE